MGLWLRAVVLWCAILVLAVSNGGLREAFLVPALGATGGLVASGVLLALLILAVAWLSARWLGTRSAKEAWSVGWLWLALTLVFEFGFGAFVQHKPWPELLAAYTFEGGNLWPLVLVSVAVAPRLARTLRHR